MIHYYRLHDVEGGGAILTDKSELQKYNDLGYGIFWTLNEFREGIRQVKKLVKINAWLVDIDYGTKEMMMERISKSPLYPTMIVETKRGYHCYWFAKDASTEKYKEITDDRLVYFLNGDKNAKDVCRILRVPNFYHCKDMNDKFMVQTVYFKDVYFSEKEMLAMFKPRPKVVYEKKQLDVAGDSFWDRVGSIDCEYALTKLSGTEAVGMQKIKLYRHNNGCKQIICDGKPTSCWVDKDGKIGSYDKGGPSIAQWINWYRNDYKETYRLIKEYFGGELNE